MAMFILRDTPLSGLDSSQIDEVFNQVKDTLLALLSSNQIQSAQAELDTIWEAAQRANNAECEAQAHWCSLIFFNNRDIAKSRFHAEQAIAYFRSTNQLSKEARILAGYSYQLVLSGEIQEADATISRAHDILQDFPNYRDTPVVYLNWSRVKIALSQFDQAVELVNLAVSAAQRLEAIFPERKPAYDSQVATSLLNKAWALQFLAKFPESKSVLQEALDLANTANDTELIGRVKLNLAYIAIVEGQISLAFKFLISARNCFEQANLEVDVATVAAAMAHLFDQLTLYRSAVSEAQTAAEHFEQAGVVGESVSATLHLIELLFRLGEFSIAKQWLDHIKPAIAASQVREKLLIQAYASHPNYSETPAAIHDSYTQLVEVYKQTQQINVPADVVAVGLLLAESMEALQLGGIKEHVNILVNIAAQASLVLPEQRARLLLSKFQPPAQAIETLRHCASLHSQLRSRMGAEELKASFVSGNSEIYKRMIDAQLQCKDWWGAYSSLIEAKAGLWAEVINPSIQQEEDKNVRGLKLLRRYWQEELNATQSSRYLTQCLEQITKIDQQIEEAARALHRIRDIESLPSAADTINAHEPETVIIEYFVGMQDVWACVLVRKRFPHWKKLCSIKKLSDLLYSLELNIGYLKNADRDAERLRRATVQLPWFNQLLTQLHQLLIKPIQNHLKQAKHLLIVPDHELYALPWSALFDGKQYVGEQASVYCSPSSALKVFENRRSDKWNDISVTFPYAYGYVGDPPLPHVAHELERLKTTIPSFVTSLSPTAADFDFKVSPVLLHIATHGEINPTAPLLSKLQLADGPLFVAEILNMNLQGTRLVTLSACETGVRPEHAGVMMAMTGAVLCAGASAVLASLWAVPDEATTLLMNEIYQALAQGLSPADALQIGQAKLRLSEYTHPFYWAGFQLFARRLHTEIFNTLGKIPQTTRSI